MAVGSRELGGCLLRLSFAVSGGLHAEDHSMVRMAAPVKVHPLSPFPYAGIAFSGIYWASVFVHGTAARQPVLPANVLKGQESLKDRAQSRAVLILIPALPLNVYVSLSIILSISLPHQDLMWAQFCTLAQRCEGLCVTRHFRKKN